MKKSKRTLVIVIGIVLVVAVAAVFFMNSRKKGGVSLPVPFALATRGPLEDRVSASGSFQADRYTVVSSKTIGIVKKVFVKPGDHVEKDDVIVVVDERDSRETLAAAEIALEETRRNLSVNLATLRSEIRKATLALEQAQRAAKNAESLKAVDGISEEDYRKAGETLGQAKSALADARERMRVAQGTPDGEEPTMDASRDGEIIASSPSYRKALLTVDGAQRALDGCVIKAEGSGTVTEISVTTGTRLLVETTVARIEDPSSVMAEVNVDEVDIGKIHEGMTAEITADSMLGKKMTGTVSRIWPIVKTDGNGRVCRVRITLELEGKRLLSGASCMARITSVLRKDTLTIPATALIPGAKPPAVWVATENAAAATDAAATSGEAVPSAGDPAADSGAKTEESPPAEPVADAKDGAKGDGKDAKKKAPPQKTYKANRREVTLGESTVSTIEVLSGLSEGERVIVDQLPLITEGMTVLDAKDAPSAGPKK